MKKKRYSCAYFMRQRPLQHRSGFLWTISMTISLNGELKYTMTNECSECRLNDIFHATPATFLKYIRDERTGSIYRGWNKTPIENLHAKQNEDKCSARKLQLKLILFTNCNFSLALLFFAVSSFANRQRPHLSIIQSILDGWFTQAKIFSKL